MDHGVLGLHGRMGEHRQLIDRLDPSAAMAEVAFTTRHDRCVGLGSAVQRLEQGRRREIGMLAQLPIDLQRLDAFPGGPEAVGDDRHGGIETHDLAHAWQGARGRIVDRADAPAEHGTVFDQGDPHPRNPDIDAIDRGAVQLAGCIQSVERFADEFEVFGVLQSKLRRDRLERRQRRELSIGR